MFVSGFWKRINDSYVFFSLLGGNIVRTWRLYEEWLVLMNLRHLYIVMVIQFSVRLFVTLLLLVFMKKRPSS